MRKKIEELIEFLNYHTNLYNKGIEEISDKEWDDKYFELLRLENETGLFLSNSPTQKIIFEEVSQLEKVEHNHKMLSLQKTKDLDELEKFVGDNIVSIMAKLDGLTCSLKYENGYLVSAETRGDGLVGENILHNIKVISNVPKRIDYTETLIIDGEIICPLDTFEEFKDEYKNPRNFASGSIRLLNSEESYKRKLKFIAWDIIKGLENEYFSSKLLQLESLGFEVVQNYHYSIYNKKQDEFKGWIEKVIKEITKNIYPIDGIVVKYNDIAYGRSLGETAHHFNNAIAYKFYDEEYESELLDIEWSIGRTGQICPIAIFKPVEIDGTIVERASLHNITIMFDKLSLFPEKGQKIWVSKRNMIIPQIERSELVPHSPINERNFLTIPTHCPICGEKTTIKKENDSSVLYCTNLNCEGKLINKLNHFCGKSGLDIKGLSKATLEKLIDWEWISCIEDIFKLSNYKKEWVNKPGFGIKSVENILTAIETSKQCNLDAFICSLGIPLIGKTASKDLVKYFPTWEDFIKAVEDGYQFFNLPNFGVEMNNTLFTFDYDEAKRIREYLTFFTTIIPSNEMPKTMENLTFVITGKLDGFKNRDELKSEIERLGGKVAGSISNKTNYLINNDTTSNSSKNISAKKYGIPIISEKELLEKFF